MPLYEFLCETCSTRFEELVAPGASPTCPRCSSERTYRRWSQIPPPASPFSLRGRRAAASEAYRREREERRKAGLPPDLPGQKPPYPAPPVNDSP